MTASVAPPGFPPEGAAQPQPPLARRGRTVTVLAALGVLAAAAVAALLALGAGSTPLSDPIAQAATVSSGQPGFQMRMALSVSSPELGVLMSATAHATVDLRDRASAMTMLMKLDEAQAVQGLGSGVMRLGMVLDGTTMYVRLPDQLASVLSANRPWIELDLAKLAGVSGLASLQTGTLGGDPSHLLDYLRAVSDSVAGDGRQVVDGVPTRHYMALLDLDRVGALLPAAERGSITSLEAVMQTHTAPVSVWVDAEHLVRRMAMTLDLGLPGRGSATEAMQIDFTDYGPQARPAPPPASEVESLPGLPG